MLSYLQNMKRAHLHVHLQPLWAFLPQMPLWAPEISAALLPFSSSQFVVHVCHLLERFPSKETEEINSLTQEYI